jgi:glycosyl transferase, family 25
MRTYLINLDRSPERLAAFRQQIDGLDLRLERFPAIDGRHLSPAELQGLQATTHQFRPLNAAEVAVFLSHRGVWQRLLDSGEPMAAVFEDDAEVSPALAEALESLESLALAQSPPCGSAGTAALADLIKLETMLRPVVLGPRQALPGAWAQPQAAALRPLLSWHAGTAGYVVQRSAAQRLLDWTRHGVADPLDQALFNPLSQVHQHMRVAQLWPAVCAQQRVLQGGAVEAKFQTTIARWEGGRRLVHYGLRTDLRRAWLRQRERWLRWRRARSPGNEWLCVPMHGRGQGPAP